MSTRCRKRPGKNSCVLVFLLLAPLAAAQPENAVRLSTAAIKQRFADVCDKAEVQDAAGTRASNAWYADGSLVNRWSNGERSGTVTGQWYAEDGMRCVVILSGLPGAEGKKRCGPVYRVGADYFSINPDGSVHGIHRLTPMDEQGSNCAD
ncbi:hypothetical protein [Pseudohalioglobus lutimaris]|uniref:DUF995 domain-containing protein n=1 Tax=Pseudohalioglobus lutimaris TaxID=1737061 RepID=A0A2N5X5E8_9GAMM|nr:hypothetical protein [Pseudohalioglobus lutimaris]PLW69704.1 hypothetical protein C0039_06765 [Pseudohalioglobus lutimaris]